MSFNELNSVENYIIKQLTGVNLNTNEVSEDTALYDGFWKYKSPQGLQRSVNEVLIEADLKAALVHLNKRYRYVFCRLYGPHIQCEFATVSSL